MSLLSRVTFCPTCVFTLVGAAAVSYVIYSKFFKKSETPKILKKDWKKDTVYLYQFFRPKSLPSLSPFCVKLEMFLKLNNIPYENIFVTSARSKYGLVPFVELNGQHFADSQLTEEHLKEHFNLKALPNPREEAYARSLARMIEQHTFPILIKYRIYDNINGFVTAVLKAFRFSDLAIFFILPSLRGHFKKRITTRINTMLGPFSDSEFHILLKKDMDCLRDALGERRYFMGDQPTAVDCAIFGHLSVVCYMEESNEVMRVVAAEYPTLQAYQERLIEQFFPVEFGRKKTN